MRRASVRERTLAYMPQTRLGHGPTEMQDGITVVALDPEGEERFQLLRRELGVSAFGINLLRLRPGQRGRIHRHARQEEVYVVLQGTLSLGVEGEEREMPRGSAVRMEPDVRRSHDTHGTTHTVHNEQGASQPRS